MEIIKYKIYDNNKTPNDKFNNIFTNNISNDYLSSSDNNFGSNKILNTEDESDNLIILD